MIESLLVANRGEIAVRILATCRRLGLRTIAVYSDADAHARHVAEADTAVRIGPPVARDSYLNVAAILGAASRTGAAAIHPGYGFLAENADFAQAVLDAGVIWVGPSPAAMRTLGDKAQARALAEQSGVPILPGYHGADQSPAVLAERARQIGYPVMIKAAAGGGGRGMRVVDRPHEFGDALQAARREALAAFGDDRVLLERFVPRPRHVEVQIMGDLYGQLIHLGERECSIQRRHQKLIEESPSPAVDPDLRARMCAAALRLGHAVNYASAGTVEFLVDEQGQFVVLEVNARLQVEHPVTEAVTGLDLVELQLRVAAGERLPMTQAEVSFDGHALEARVVAEDPLADFLPSSGRIETVTWPDSARVDTWVVDGTVVSPDYDSLLAKVIAHDVDRAAAMGRLAHALRAVWIDGVADNVDLLLATIEHPAFRAGALHTGFLDEQHIVDELAQVPGPVLAGVSALEFLAPAPDGDPWRLGGAWRLARQDQPVAWQRSGRRHTARVSAALAHASLEVDLPPAHPAPAPAASAPAPSAPAAGAPAPSAPASAAPPPASARSAGRAPSPELEPATDPQFASPERSGSAGAFGIDRGPTGQEPATGLEGSGSAGDPGMGGVSPDRATAGEGERPGGAGEGERLAGAGGRYAVRGLDLEGRAARRRVSVDGQALTIWVDGDHRVVEWQGRTVRLRRPPPLRVADVARTRAHGPGAGQLAAPMPVRIVQLFVAQGERVAQRQPLIVLEAMKMEHVVEAPYAGTVAEVSAQVGQHVASGALLLTLGELDQPENVE